MKQLIIAGIAAGAIATGSYIGYRAITDREFRSALAQRCERARATSKRKMETLSEDMALQRARITRDPSVNQRWIANQWRELGY